MGRGIWVESVDAYDLVVGTRGQVAAIVREADGMNCAGMVAHRSQLFRLVVVGIVSIIDGLCRPYSYVTIWQKDSQLSQAHSMCSISDLRQR